LSALFERDLTSFQLIHRSTDSLLQSSGAEQQKIVKQHHTRLHDCAEFVGSLQDEGLPRLGHKSRQAVVLTLLRRRLPRLPREARGSFISFSSVSFIAVKEMYALLRNDTRPAIRFMRDAAVVYYRQHATIFDDDYHRAFCAMVIGFTCGINSLYALRSIIDSMKNES
jgi:hypothetical protein